MDMVSLNIGRRHHGSRSAGTMGVTLMRTSYSTIFSESLDFNLRAWRLPSGRAGGHRRFFARR